MLTALLSSLNFILLSNYLVAGMAVYLLGDLDRSLKKITIGIAEMIVMYIIISLSYYFSKDFRIPIYTGWILICIYAFAFSKQKTHIKIATVSIIAVVPHHLSRISGEFIAGIALQFIHNAAAIYIISDIIEICFCIITVIFLKKYSTNHVDNVPKVYSIIIVLVTITSEIIMQNMSPIFHIDSSETLRIISAVLAVIFYFFSISVYYLVYVLSTSYTKNQEILLLQQREAEALQSVEHTNVMHEEMRVLRHEYKNNVLTMKIMLEGEQYDKLNDYLDTYLNADASGLNSIDCGNRVLNNIFNLAQNNCRSKGVDFDVLANVPPELPFDEGDITSLLVNLIDNAIEASVATGEPSVSVKMRVEKSYCLIAVFNTVNGDVLGKNPDLTTTKRDKSIHGVGLKVIRSIVEKYNGYIKFEQKGEMFKASLMLEMC